MAQKDFDTVSVSSNGSRNSQRDLHKGRNSLFNNYKTVNHSKKISLALPLINEPLTSNKNHGPDLYLPHLKPKQVQQRVPHIFEELKSVRKMMGSSMSSNNNNERSPRGDLSGRNGSIRSLYTPVLKHRDGPSPTAKMSHKVSPNNYKMSAADYVRTTTGADSLFGLKSYGR